MFSPLSSSHSMAIPTRMPDRVRRVGRRRLDELGRVLGRYLFEGTGPDQPPVWLVGDGRSGTTWVSLTVNFDERFRFLFEPCHPTQVQAFPDRRFPFYRSPDAEDPELDSFYRAVFHGGHQHPWTDKFNQRWWYRGRLVKDIYGHLFMGWIQRRFPDVRTILLIRNPFAVALSKSKLSKWDWATDITHLAAPGSLDEATRTLLTEWIQRVRSPIERGILAWSLLHRVPFDELMPGSVHVCFYEQMVTSFDTEARALLDFARGASERHSTHASLALQQRYEDVAPVGRTSGDDGSISKRLESWRSEISQDEVRRGREILEAFGLDHLYGDAPVPVGTSSPLVARIQAERTAPDV